MLDEVDIAMKNGNFPLILWWNHSIAIGTIKAVLRNVKSLGVIWFDAHGDNTHKTSPTGNIHGMPVASLLGLGTTELKEIGGKEYKIDKEMGGICFVGCEVWMLEEEK